MSILSDLGSDPNTDPSKSKQAVEAKKKADAAAAAKRQANAAARAAVVETATASPSGRLDILGYGYGGSLAPNPVGLASWGNRSLLGR